LTIKGLKMAKNFRITTRWEENSLYFDLWGDFDEISAIELIYTLRDKVNESDKIYVETGNIKNLSNTGKHAFEKHFSLSPALHEKIIFIGDNASQITPYRSD